MKKALTLLVFIVFAINNISAQEPIDVAEIAIKIGAKGEEELYYGFAEGDQIVFSFKEADEREVKEVEIIELPSNSKFQDIETKEIKNKIIKVNKKGIYKFRFYNSALLKGRICKVKIQRIIEISLRFCNLRPLHDINSKPIRYFLFVMYFVYSSCSLCSGLTYLNAVK